MTGIASEGPTCHTILEQVPGVDLGYILTDFLNESRRRKLLVEGGWGWGVVNGSWDTYAKQEIKKVALKALYKLRKEMGDHFRDDVQLTMKILDTVISPILTYGSEVWGGGGVDHGGKLENDPIEFV